MSYEIVRNCSVLQDKETGKYYAKLKTASITLLKKNWRKFYYWNSSMVTCRVEALGFVRRCRRYASMTSNFWIDIINWIKFITA